MAYTTVNDPSAQFQTTLYTGNGGSQDITNTGNSNLKPDWLWIKQRSGAAGVSSHVVKDSNRGVTKELYPNANSAEGTSSLIDAFLTDGFSINNTANDHYNYSGALYVSWQWKANGGTTASNSNGTITSTVQANDAAGFSIVTWTASGSSGTVGHGLSSAPTLTFRKSRGSTADWFVHTTQIDGSMDYLKLNTTDAASNSSLAAPTATTIGSDANSNNYVAYCFAEKKGYSKFGIYSANGNNDGSFTYTGFRPAWLMIKCTSHTGEWFIVDTTRELSQPVGDKYLQANSTANESSGAGKDIDILSNGFKNRAVTGFHNDPGRTYSYYAFASAPLVASNNIIGLAR